MKGSCRSFPVVQLARPTFYKQEVTSDTKCMHASMERLRWGLSPSFVLLMLLYCTYLTLPAHTLSPNSRPISVVFIPGRSQNVHSDCHCHPQTWPGRPTPGFAPWRVCVSLAPRSQPHPRPAVPVRQVPGTRRCGPPPGPRHCQMLRRGATLIGESPGEELVQPHWT